MSYSMVIERKGPRKTLVQVPEAVKKERKLPTGGKFVLADHFFHGNDRISGDIDYHKVMKYHNELTRGKPNPDFHSEEKVKEISSILEKKGTKNITNLAHQQEFAQKVKDALKNRNVKWNFTQGDAKKTLNHLMGETLKSLTHLAHTIE